MIKKLKMWLYKKIFKDITEMHISYQLEIQKVLKQKNEEIKNLKLRLLQLTNKGEIKWK